MKLCRSCGETKPAEDFGRRSGAQGHLLRGACRECERRSAGQWRKQNPEVVRANNHRGSFRRRGVTEEWYLARLAEQGGGCAICGSTAGDRRRRLYVDHDHASGAPRGLLCQSCNHAIGLLRDDPKLATAAADYLVAHASAPA